MATIRTISTLKAKKLLTKNNTKLLDVRSAVFFRSGSLPGAINITINNISILFTLPRTTTLILFGNSDIDPDINVVFNYAAQLGFVNLFSIGSKENWQ